MTSTSEKLSDTISEQELSSNLAPQSSTENDSEESTSSILDEALVDLEEKIHANQNLKEAYIMNVPYRKSMVDSNGEEIIITKEAPYIHLLPNRSQRRRYLKQLAKQRRHA